MIELNKLASVLIRASERLDLPQEAFGNGSQIQISGCRQVQIERHRGVAGYAPARIVVRSVRGTVCIAGEALTIAAMNRQRVVIRGRIHAVTLEEL